MEQKKSNVGTVVLAIIITSIAVGGGVYTWQSSQVIQPTVKEVTQPAVTTPVASVSALNMDGLSFTLPKDWVLAERTARFDSGGVWDVAKFKVPDLKYNVTLAMEVFKNDVTYKIDSAAELLKTTVSGAKIYNTDYYHGTTASYDLIYSGNIYSINFPRVESDQPRPANNRDDMWFPNTTVTANDTLNFLATVQLKSN